MSIKKNSTSSTFSAASEDLASASKQPDLFGRSHSVSESHIAKPSSANTGPTRQSTTMSEPSTQMDLEELTSSSVASHASPGPKPGSSEAQKMTAISGRKWLNLLESYGLAGQFAKMCGALLTNQWASSAAFLTWRASATKPSHLLFRLAPSMPRTDATASGLLHTPTSKANQFAPSMKERDLGSWWPTPGLWRTPMAADGTHNHCLAPSVLSGKTTMTLTNQVRGVQRGLWPTPVARDYRHPNKKTYLERGGGKKGEQLVNQIGGALNPTWVEWLMGFPVGWTNLTAEELQAVSKTECRGSKPSATRSCRKSSGKSAERF